MRREGTVLTKSLNRKLRRFILAMMLFEYWIFSGLGDVMIIATFKDVRNYSILNSLVRYDIFKEGWFLRCFLVISLF